MCVCMCVCVCVCMCASLNFILVIFQIFQVTTVELCELPGHSLSPLGACVNLKHLKMTHCGLIALDSLSHCKHLQCIDVQVSSVSILNT